MPSSIRKVKTVDRVNSAGKRVEASCDEYKVITGSNAMQRSGLSHEGQLVKFSFVRVVDSEVVIVTDSRVALFLACHVLDWVTASQGHDAFGSTHCDLVGKNFLGFPGNDIGHVLAQVLVGHNQHIGGDVVNESSFSYEGESDNRHYLQFIRALVSDR